MTPTTMGGNIGVKGVKLMYFLKTLLLYSGAEFRHTKYLVMMTNEGSTKYLDFTTPEAGVLVIL